MEYLIVSITVLFGAGLTFFSGFGLGTLMLPVFSLFFDLPVAVGATAIVHFANNIFKFALVSKYIHLTTYFRLGFPALFAAIAGGFVLTYFDTIPPLIEYTLGKYSFQITPVKIGIGGLMIFFAWFDLDPRFSKMNVSARHLPFGGILSGFFGGFSGHQGAFRATFLTKAGLTKEQFVGTSNAVSLTVDLMRMTVYFWGAKAIYGESKLLDILSDSKSLLATSIIFAFIGTIIGKKLLTKTTINGIQKTVGVLLVLMGSLLATGIL